MKYENGPRKVRLHDFEGLFFFIFDIELFLFKKNIRFSKSEIFQKGEMVIFWGKLTRRQVELFYYIFILFK